MKKIVVLLLAIAMAMAMAACGSSSGTAASHDSSSTATGKKTTLTIAYCAEVLDENETAYTAAIQYGIDQYNKSADAKYHIAKLVIDNANSSVDTQNKQLEDCVTNGVNVVILEAVDDVGNKSGAQYVIDHGVKLIDVRGGLTKIANCACCPCNFASEAKLMHAWWKDWIEKNTDKKLNIGVVFATQESKASEVRVNWVYDFAKEYPDKVKVDVKGYGKWATDPTQKLVEDWIQTYPDINLIVCANDEEALGAVNALKSAGKLKDVMVTGVNGGKSGTAMLQAKQMTVTVGQLKDQAGLAYLEVAIKVFEGKKVNYDSYGIVSNYDKDYTFLKVITPDTVADWVKYKSQFSWWA